MSSAPREQRPTVLAWRGEWVAGGLTQFGQVAAGRGRKASISDDKIAEVVRLTTQSVPEGATHWSCRMPTRSAMPHHPHRGDLRVHNDAPVPFIWTATAEQILEKVIRARTTLQLLSNQN